MLREHLVVGARLDQIALRRKQLKPDRHRVEAAYEEEKTDRTEIQHRDTLVILR